MFIGYWDENPDKFLGENKNTFRRLLAEMDEENLDHNERIVLLCATIFSGEDNLCIDAEKIQTEEFIKFAEDNFSLIEVFVALLKAEDLDLIVVQPDGTTYQTLEGWEFGKVLEKEGLNESL